MSVNLQTPTNISSLSTTRPHSSQAELIVGHFGEEQTKLIFDKISASFGNNRNFVVIVPTSQVKKAVSKRLLRDSDGWLGNRIQTLHEFVYNISNTRFGSQVRELLWWMLAIKKLPEETPLGRLKKFPNTVSAISIAIKELAQANIAPEELSEFSKRRPLLLQLSSLYQAAVKEDIIPLQGAIKKTVETYLRGKKYDDIFVTGFLYFHPTQLNLINALKFVSDNLVLTLPYEDTRPNVYGLSEENIDLLPSHRKIFISRSKFIEDIPLNIVEGKSVEHEVTSLLYEVKRKLIDGFKVDSIAILLREPYRYRSVILRVANELKIPVAENDSSSFLPSIWLNSVKDDLPVDGSIGDFILQTEKLINSLKDQESKLWRELRSTLEELVVHLDDVREINVTLREWETLWLAQRREREKFRGRGEIKGVNLIDIETPHWGGYEFVAIPGLAEHWFPKPPPSPPLLSYNARDEINKFIGRKSLWIGSQYRVREELLFNIAIDRASDELLLSYPINSNKREKIRKSHLLEELLHIHPKWNRIEPKIEESTPRRIIESIVTDCSIRVSDEALNYIRKNGLNLLNDLIRKLKVEQNRISGSAVYNGEFVNKELIKSFITPWMKSGRFSVTGLERYGHCPFRFLSRDLFSLPEPEKITDGIPSLELGSILHKVLHKFYENRLKNGSEGVTFESLECAIQDIEKITDEILKEKDSLSKSLHPLLWNAERTNLKFLLKGLLSSEANLSVQKKSKPLYLEYGFSIPLEIDENINVELSGQIDRVDLYDEEGLFIIDYKKGKYVPATSNIKKGISLQLPLYLKAIKELSSNETNGFPVVGGAYYAISDFTLKGKIPSRSVTLTEAIESSIEWAKKYILSISQGSFAVNPKECRGEDCAFHRICRVNRIKTGE